MFKYNFGTRLRQGLTMYTVIGHTNYEDGTREYVLNFWLAHHQGAGSSVVHIPASLVEDEREVKVAEV